MQDFLIEVRKKAKKKVLYLPHAMTQMNQPDRMITVEEVRDVVFGGKLIEDYPEDPQGGNKMECFYCKGKMKKGRTAYTISRKGYHFVLDNMPAWLCTQCGEAHFEETGVREIQKMLLKIDPHVQKLHKASVAAT